LPDGFGSAYQRQQQQKDHKTDPGGGDRRDGGCQRLASQQLFGGYRSRQQRFQAAGGFLTDD